MSHDYDDDNLNTLLKEIDNLMLRIGDQSPETLRQTGRFPQSQSDMPKKFSQTPKKHQITPPKKVHIKSPSSSSSSSEEVRKKPTKSIMKSQQNKSQCSKSQCKSQLSQKQSIISNNKKSCSQLPKQQQVIKTNDVFCVICEEFIPLQFVSNHQYECFESKEFNTKLMKLRDLLSMRYEMIENEQLRTLVTIIHGCTQNIIDAKDSYGLQKCIDDFYVLKSQLNNFDEAYNVLTVTAKVQEVSNQKQQLYLTQFQPQISRQQQLNTHPPESIISYQTNNTSLLRKRLFEQPKLNKLPKQLIQLPKSNNDASTQISKKQGIEYGNQYDSSQKRKFITLSSGKKENNTNTNNNKNNNDNNNNNNNNNNNSQLNQSPQRTLISGISSFFSRLGTQGNEGNKKRFFDLSVRKKNQLPQNHAAQNILISEMYEQMRKQQICENEWNEWIDNIYMYA